MKLRVLEIRNNQRASKLVESDDSLQSPDFNPLTGRPAAQVERAPRVLEEAAPASRDAAAVGSGRILLFVHGFGVSPESAAVMTEKLATMLRANGRDYDETVSVVWDASGPFLAAEHRADDAGEEQLRQEIEDLIEAGMQIDLIGHSLGCRPVLACLRALGLQMNEDSASPVQNAVLLAGAVRDEILDEDKPHHFSPLAADYLYVAHSARDMVINGLFRLARFTGGLGGGGPERFWKRWNNEDEQIIMNNIVVIDCVEAIPDHGDYFKPEHAEPVFRWLADDMNRPPLEGGPWGFRIEV